MKNLRESFNSNRSKILLTLAVIWLTNSALIENLNAQNPNNWANPKMEQVDKNDILQVKTFMSDLNKALSQYNIQITLSPEQEKLAINGVGRMDSRGKKEAIKLMVNLITTGKVSPEAKHQTKIENNDRDNIIWLAFDAIEMTYDSKNAKLENVTADENTYNKYADVLSDLTDKFWIDRTIETDRLNNSIAQNEEIANQKAKEAEELMLKTYRIAPNDKKLKELAIETKQIFDKYEYKYSTQTAELFAKLGIK
jgi:hypothetical protein